MNIRQTLIPILTLCLSLSYGQTLDTKEIEKIQGFGIDYQSNIVTDSDSETDFLKILKADRKRKKNKTFGIVIGGLGVLTTAFGVTILAREDTNPYSHVIGGFITGIGVAEMGISIPIFRTSKKRKGERDKIIYIYNPN